MQKADRVPLALSQFSRRAAERPCENWSAAPGCRCPNMQRGSQPACIFGRHSSCGALNMRRIRADACIFRPLRQRRLPVSSTGCGRRRCPCSASPVSAAGSGSATQPTTAPYFVHRTRSPPLPLLRLAASAAGSASAAQPTTRRCAPTACGCAPLLGGSEPQTALSAFTLHGVWDAINFAAWPWGLFLPTHPPTEVTPGLRPRPLTGALCLQLLPPGPRSVNLEGITPRLRQPFSLYWHCLS